MEGQREQPRWRRSAMWRRNTAQENGRGGLLGGGRGRGDADGRKTRRHGGGRCG
ncbi:hypothetical protein ACP70R_017688 [Stipagrostis hirtigluma subsp. patula]